MYSRNDIVTDSPASKKEVLATYFTLKWYCYYCIRRFKALKLVLITLRLYSSDPRGEGECQNGVFKSNELKTFYISIQYYNVVVLNS